MAERQEELERKACEGDPAAFAILWNGFLPQIRKLYGGMLETEEDIEDAAGELYLKMSKSIVGEALQKGFAPWAFTVARNFAIDWLRGADSEDANIPRAEPVTADGGETFTDPLAHARYESDRLADDLAAGGDRQKEAEESLRPLPVLQRRAVILAVVEEFSPEEIGRYLGVPADKARALLEAAWTTLRRRRAP